MNEARVYENDHDILLRLDGDIRVLTEQIASLKDVLRAEFDARDKALLGVAEETERVRKQQNEWRGTVTDLASNKVDTDRYDERNKVLDTAISQMRDELAQTRGTTHGLDQAWGYVVGVIGVVTAVATMILYATR